jgi:molybdopterin-guanine dinucleotide biosynthesis protein A
VPLCLPSGRRLGVSVVNSFPYLAESNSLRTTHMDVILMAGGRISGDYAAATGTEVKALVPVGGRPTLRRILDALRPMPELGRLCVVGPENVREVCGGDAEWTPETPTALGNLLAGLDHLRLPDDVPFLLCGADVPCLDAPSVADFLRRCPDEADLCMPLVTREAYEAAFPGSRNRYVPLREGWLTAGSQYVLRPRVVRANRDLLESLFERRKSQVGMAGTLGLSVLWKLLTRRLSVPDLERRATGLIRHPARAVMECRPELAYDLDDLPAWQYLQERLPG